ncbi:flagellar M-ring protein FliF [Salinibacillus kushneri]|uniref:Flagellar M-ring protein n=1 Tax=Salinibacillus kushneri TaxID=237682 RepID=A0A1I0EAP1_9BACI|nr:flagellar basal-body MS-ring/collar protein FliF [Salinibacillus kushneri]SET41929.1 flagellar M-ring protein FliF [Salinibacillus kushneri]
MNKVREYYQKTIEFWNKRPLMQKSLIIGGAVLIFAIILFVTLFANRSNMVPLYSDLSLQETGQIKTELESRGIKYEVTDGGSSILVPKENVDSLLVDLAAQGIPDSGNIDYSFFSENASWGMTDGQREMIELDTLQTEISNLINSIQGIQSSDVLITKPEKDVFVNEKQGEASASVVVHTEPGYDFDQSQIDGLYHLVSKAVPNLSTDNIVLMNQNFEYFDQENSNNATAGNSYAEQQEIKKDIERDIQSRVQQLLSTMMGRENVVVSVTPDIDFTKENRVEELVEPVDEEDMEGLPVSVERITETYSGENPPEGAVGTGEEEVANYPAGEDGEGNSEYEKVEERINNEFNRIQKDIVESPYKVRDLGIQVAVDSKKSQPDEEGNAQYLTAQEQETVRESISSILNSMISTTVSGDYGEVNPEEKVSIVFQEFSSQPVNEPAPAPGIPTWLYIAGGILLLAVIILLILLVRRRNRDEAGEYQEEQMEEQVTIPDIEQPQETEETMRKKQLENMAKDKPEEFAKLLRSWISED